MTLRGSSADTTSDGTSQPNAALTALTLCAGEGIGELLVLDEPLSFWGGTDLATGVITDVHHPQRGTSLAGRVVAMSASRGSSSSSSVLAEQLRAGVGPSALILTGRDAILALGALAAAELYGSSVPIVLIDANELAGLAADSGIRVRVHADAARATIEAQ